LASVTGRIGYGWDRFLGYVKAGGAWENADYNGLASATGLVVSTTSATFGGWTVGIGGEYAFTDWLSGFVEYDYYKLRHPIDHARHDRGHPPDTSQHQGIRQRVQGRPEPSTESRPGGRKVLIVHPRLFDQ
jgi:hypothetical protein